MFTWFSGLTRAIQVLILYGVIINLITFFYFGADKLRAQNNLRRVSEKALWILTLLGGSLGALLAMKIFRHKTKKLSFQAMLAVILAIQILLVFLIFQAVQSNTPTYL